MLLALLGALLVGAAVVVLLPTDRLPPWLRLYLGVSLVCATLAAAVFLLF
ncbi:hypothetical protein [Aeromicrobium fastidiosum]|nr:hypothetical protein [Aeromicrobium fastidiosum]MBP2392427.1 hypothetical protein [Aeromicrobium fastidiosum]